MSSVVFVHGTGVRQPAYDALFKRVGTELARRSSPRDLVQCYWGGEFGARLGRDGSSIPQYNTTRAVTGADEEEIAVTRWEMLSKDPLFELRMLAHAPSKGAVRLGEESPGEELIFALKNLQPGPELSAALGDAELTDAFESARRELSQSPVVITALRNAPAQLDDYRKALARALVALAVREAEVRDTGVDGGTAWVLAGPRRDELVNLLVAALGGDERGLLGWVGSQLAEVAAWGTTALVKRKRGAISDSGTPAAGDILLYQARGEPIRNHIRTVIASAKPPVTVIAHSLGGIAAVDALVLQAMPSVELLVTVGSQSPFFYELGALFSLPPGSRLPDHFPRWLNVYDPRDFLSYLAKPVFEDERIVDVEVNNRESFPRAHSAYWSNPALWDAVDASWAKLA